MALSASQVYAQVFQSLTGVDPNKERWVYDVYNVAKEYIDSGTFAADDALLFDIVLSDENAPPAYKERFKAITELKSKQASFVPTVAEYLNMERKYKDVLTATGLSDLATNEQISTFIANEVSADEMSDRITKAFVAIDNADELTKNVLAERFPGLTRQDVARGLLLGRESTYEIAKKIEGARVATEARRANITPTLAEQEIASQGLSQQELRKGFQQLAAEQPGIQQASRTFRQNIQQQELEREAFGIAPSETARGLRSQARAEFGGQSGIVTGSLSRKKQV
jgi:uncharacterized protein (DUF433 family)